MTVTAPPRPPRPNDPMDRQEIEALVEALIEEARRRAQRRRRRNAAVVTLVALVGVALFAVLGRSAQSQSSSPALSARSSLSAGTASSKIAFLRGAPNRGGWAVYVMNADGSGQRRLSQQDVQFTPPAWSPDGQKIAFEAARDMPDSRNRKSDVYVMNADGSGQQRLTRNPAGDLRPAWSPDGQKIAFASYRNRGDHWDVSVMNADGSDQRSLTRSLAHDFAPAWSPDGQKIAFTRGRQRWSPRCTSSCVDVYVMDADGSGPRNLTPGVASGEGPVWSPDGRKLAFVSRRDGNSEVYVVNADGSGQRRLTRSPAWDHDPAWSPDGRKIAFVSDVSRPTIYVMNADGSGQRELTPGGSPAWSSDGRKIAFERASRPSSCCPPGPSDLSDLRLHGNSGISVIKADGSDLRRLTRSPSWDWAPAWSPAQKK